MTAQFFLIADPDADPATCLNRLDEALAAAPVAALLLRRGTRGEGSYKALVKAVAPRAPAAGIAVLIEGAPGWVRTLGADGDHGTAERAQRPDGDGGNGDCGRGGVHRPKRQSVDCTRGRDRTARGHRQGAGDQSV